MRQSPALSRQLSTQTRRTQKILFHLAIRSAQPLAENCGEMNESNVNPQTPLYPCRLTRKRVQIKETIRNHGPQMRRRRKFTKTTRPGLENSCHHQPTPIGRLLKHFPVAQIPNVDTLFAAWALPFHGLGEFGQSSST